MPELASGSSAAGSPRAHLDRVRMAELVGREAPPDPRLGRESGAAAAGRRRPTMRVRRSGPAITQNSGPTGSVDASRQPAVRARVHAQRVHPDLATLVAFAVLCRGGRYAEQGRWWSSAGC